MQSPAQSSPVNWEFGSEFHWPSFDESSSVPVLPAESVLFASGRAALLALIRMGVAKRGWRRWYVPTYFCSEVASTISSCDIDVIRYEDSPLWPTVRQSPTQFQSGDVFLLVNYFGLRDTTALAHIDLGPAELVEDHTHDPWSIWTQSSEASYCLASLRKTLPLPDGAALWSPRTLPLPDRLPATPAAETSTLLKTAAMCLKRLYLDGHSIEKDFYRKLQLEGESLIDRSGVSGISTLSRGWLNTLPWQTWRNRRRSNYDIFCDILGELPNLSILAPRSNDICPFAIVICFDEPEMRNHVRSELIANRIYPAVHWPFPLDSPPALQTATNLSRRLLSLPCDFRYSVVDLRHVATAIRDAVQKATRSQLTNHHRATCSQP